VYPSCYGSTNGEATAKVIVGSGNYTYSWSANAGSQNTAKATGLGAGLFTVTITDLVLNQTFIDTLKLTQPDSLKITLLSKKDEDSVRNNGMIEVSVAGGTSPYTYAWSGGVSTTTNIASGLKGGTYTLTVTDAWGCTKTFTDSISTIGNALGNTEWHLTEGLSVYPNPAADFVEIKAHQNLSGIKIYNISGATVLEEKPMQKQVRLDLRALPAGLYLLQAELPKGKSVVRLQVK
jgi:hypothetical protein